MIHIMFADNSIQFPRLLAEIRAVGLSPKQLAALSTSMDLPPQSIEEILERAENEWERLKEKHACLPPDSP